MMSGSGTSIYALSPLLQNKDDDNDSDSDSDNNVQKAVDAILDKHPGLKYFKCHFVSKEDTVGCWYDYDYDSIWAYVSIIWVYMSIYEDMLIGLAGSVSICWIYVESVVVDRGK